MLLYLLGYLKESGMGKAKENKPYDFTTDYKKLPVKKRVGLIRIAKNLLNQQEENNAILADASPTHIEEKKEC